MSRFQVHVLFSFLVWIFSRYADFQVDFKHTVSMVQYRSDFIATEQRKKITHSHGFCLDNVRLHVYSLLCR